MLQHNIHGIAILDQHSHLVDCLSARDIRVLGNMLQHRELINEPVSDFKEKALQMYPEQTPAHVRTISVLPYPRLVRWFHNCYTL
jgi:hypothetical protein